VRAHPVDLAGRRAGIAKEPLHDFNHLSPIAAGRFEGLCAGQSKGMGKNSHNPNRRSASVSRSASTIRESHMSDPLDPNTLTAAAFNRRAFVGLSAGATATSALTPAFAQGTADFGKPHPPIVPPNDPSITVQTLKLARPDVVLDAYARRTGNADRYDARDRDGAPHLGRRRDDP
jgi:hypothetical protein